MNLAVVVVGSPRSKAEDQSTPALSTAEDKLEVKVSIPHYCIIVKDKPAVKVLFRHYCITVKDNPVVKVSLLHTALL